MKGAAHHPEDGAAVGTPAGTSASLIEGVRSKDQERWRAMVALYEPLLLRRCRARVGDEADARDIVQDVFLTVLQKIDEFRLPEADGGGPRHPAFRPWLQQILRYKILEYSRRHPVEGRGAGGSAVRDRLERVSDSTATSGEGEALDPEEPAEREERSLLLRRALEVAAADVEARTWRAAWLRLVEQRPAAEIAAELGMSAASVHTARSRVLRRAREILAAFGEDLGEREPSRA